MAIASRPKRNSAHRKRNAQHHRHSKGYLRHYWPYIPMLLIVGLGIFANNNWSRTGSVLGARSDYSTQALLEQTNIQRSKNNLPGLSVSQSLNAAAQAKANDMVIHNYWAHNSPDGKTPWSFITGAGYQYQAAGENLAYGFKGSNDTITGWMNSKEHRDNVLNSQYKNVGFGVATSPNYQGHGQETIVVAEYALPAGATAADISSNVDSANAVKSARSNLVGPSKTVARVQVMTGGKSSWSLIAVSAIAGAAFMLFVVKHGIKIRKVVREGESFVLHHPLIDITIVLVFTVGFLLTRSSGIIR